MNQAQKFDSLMEFIWINSPDYTPIEDATWLVERLDAKRIPLYAASDELVRFYNDENVLGTAGLYKFPDKSIAFVAEGKVTVWEPASEPRLPTSDTLAGCVPEGTWEVEPMHPYDEAEHLDREARTNQNIVE